MIDNPHIPNEEDGNPFLSLGSLLDTHGKRIVSVGKLATAIEKHGIYGWDRYGRFKHFAADTVAAGEALDLLALVHGYESRDEPNFQHQVPHPLDATAGGSDDPFLRFGWASCVAPDFDALATAEDYVQMPRVPASQRRARIVAYVDRQCTMGITKTDSFKALAVKEGCGPDNIERLYKEGKRKG